MMEHVAIVTGASRGIGAAVAARLARHGYAICVNFVADQASADAVVGQIRSLGGIAIAVKADVGDAGTSPRGRFIHATAAGAGALATLGRVIPDLSTTFR